MAEYISREGAIECIQPHVKPTSVYGEGYMQAIEHAVEILSLMPAADVQQVRRGKWEEERYDDLLGCYIATCSECGYESTDRYRITDNHKRCEYCGASMEDLIPIETVLADMESDCGIVAEGAKAYLDIHRDEYRGERKYRKSAKEVNNEINKENGSPN